jgi:cyclic pyranopterin phosphate synthase
MAQRRQIRASRSLEGEGERPARGYGEPEAGACANNVAILARMSNGENNIRMIDVGAKPVSLRTARASGRLVGRPETIAAIRGGNLAKGDAVATARLAGVMAAKKTSEIVPLCHPLPLDAIEMAIGFEPEAVVIEAVVRATAKTGVEMEALVAVSAAALAIYDMAKSIDPGMTITAVQLEEKTGGARGDYGRA